MKNRSAGTARRDRNIEPAKLRSFQSIYGSFPAGVVHWRADGAILDANDRFLNMLGYTREQVSRGELGWADITPPEYRDLDRRAVAEIEAVGSSGPWEKAYIASDGRHVPVLVTGIATETRTQGIALVVDLTDVKRVQARREQLFWLMAQETERKRMARDIHDDLSQRVAALILDVGAVSRSLPALMPQRRRLRAIQRDLGALADQLHSLSHALHGSVVEQIGLAAALEKECQRVRQVFGLKVEFQTDGSYRHLPANIALNVLRIAQECLTNAARHAGAAGVLLILTSEGDLMHLHVEDAGLGFDPETARSRGGLGLVSIAERVQILRGRVEVNSQPGCGTKIDVWVPMGGVLR